ncbi:Mce associated membrane protein [Mycobacterium bohemicum DSM 44277]|uniref:Twin-arginine translocation pathway signal n=2 Tax=Mycobacterium bohemicum TaxID=56425 RepID=A0A1X1QVG6_MYCBE|nr:hypothetical protein [Mycobacterium bohemicum]MCV6972545.1 hypothetical protein [Mycobacterium bohemicum]ORU95361.1 hypothetical protein AWB93_00160 [Mycobacterium bohemicum]CPR01821.1 Mce associated membrane protein [Mycobacterium bohemicum DSM 44277]
MTTLREEAAAVVEADAEDIQPAVEHETAPHEPASEDGAGAAAEETGSQKVRRHINWSRVLAFGVLPGLALMLGLASGYFAWLYGSAKDRELSRTESVRIAGEDTVALLSYTADSVDRDLGTARERLTGDFKDAYTTLTREVVIPGAKQKHISATAKVTAAAPVSATANQAVVLLFVNQTVTIGDGAPTDTQPVIRVTLEKVKDRWLISHFDPV